MFLHLKHLSLLGFKSFADHVELTLEPGITAIVGPNGCGKSNIADALRWVLGEQSMKTLRGSRMDDIIFAGSDVRKPLGLAQVELVLDNSDGFLPVEYSEVSVTRRLYRSGESEFLINKSQVRLRDIQEMFLDTGLGREAYSVIGQGKIDALLSARAEDRRAVFEEAAGVVKYKLKKASAMRRLQETEANLTRVADLLGEIEDRLGPLQAQSELALEHQRLQIELTRLEINQGGRDLADLSENLARGQKELADIRQKDGEREGEENVLEAGLEETRLALAAVDEEISRDQQELYSLGNRSEQERGRLELIREKSRVQGEKLDALTARRSETEERSRALKARMDGQQAGLAELGEARAQIAVSLGESESRIAARDAALHELTLREEDLKAEIIEDMNRAAGARNDLQTIQMERDYLSRQKEELANRMKNLAGEKTSAEERLGKARDEQNRLAASGVQAQAEEKRLLERKSLLQAGIDKAEAGNQDLRERIKELESRLDVLMEMERTYQGYFPGVRSIIMEAGRESFAGAVKGLVAELFVVRTGYEAAMEAALGSALQFVIIEDDASAQEAIAYLKRTGHGRATFLPMNMIQGKRSTARDLPAVMSECQAHHAADLLQYDPVYQGIVDYLLGNTLVAHSLSQAVSLSKKTGKIFRIVTTEGDIIGVGGAMTGGARDKRKPQILGRKSEIEGLRQKKDEISRALAEGSAEAARLKQDLAGLEQGLAVLAERRRELAQASASSGKAVENYEGEIRRLEEEIQLIRFQLADQEDKSAGFDRREEELREALSAADKLLADHRRELDEAGGELRRRRSEKDDDFQALSDLRVALATKMEEEKKLRESLAETARTTAELEDELKRIAAELEEGREALAALAREEASCGEAIDGLAKAEESLQAAVALAKSKRGRDQEEAGRIEHRLRALRRERHNLSERAHRQELSLGEYRVKIEDLRANLAQKYGLDWEEHVESQWEMTRGEAAARIGSLRGEIQALGPVNPGAVADYEALRTRYEFLQRQKDDLDKARGTLEKIIIEVERTIRRRFSETFSAIRRAFQVLFQNLFSGGHADLILLDPDDPLESGVEIMAQPPGKRLQSLSLLSGGERAMTAIALLFAILEIKPSPFCILDEIDATLDEANVGRFADLLTDSGSKMQFIVITHRRGTMEVAGTLYGVTMEELGVSKLISIDLKEKAG